MRAFALTDFGAAPEIIDLPLPEPAEGEVRVRVRAASVNGFDLSVADGRLKDMMEHRFPVVLGKDFAGTVDVVGPGVTGYQVGDRVFGVVMKPYLGDGSFAEYVTVPTTVGLAALPDSIDFVEGATLGVAGVTAIAAVDAAELKPDHRVLVVGATGGVGNQVVQLAAKAGAHVLATAALRAGTGAGERPGGCRDRRPHRRRARRRPPRACRRCGRRRPPRRGPARPAGGAASGWPVRLHHDHVARPAVRPRTPPSSPSTPTPTRPSSIVLAGQHVDGTSRVHLQDTYPLDQAPAAFAAFTGGTLGKLVITTA